MSERRRVFEYGHGNEYQEITAAGRGRGRDRCRNPDNPNSTIPNRDFDRRNEQFETHHVDPRLVRRMRNSERGEPPPPRIPGTGKDCNYRQYREAGYPAKFPSDVIERVPRTTESSRIRVTEPAFEATGVLANNMSKEVRVDHLNSTKSICMASSQRLEHIDTGFTIPVPSDPLPLDLEVEEEEPINSHSPTNSDVSNITVEMAPTSSSGSSYVSAISCQRVVDVKGSHDKVESVRLSPITNCQDRLQERKRKLSKELGIEVLGNPPSPAKSSGSKKSSSSRDSKPTISSRPCAVNNISKAETNKSTAVPLSKTSNEELQNSNQNQIKQFSSSNNEKPILKGNTSIATIQNIIGNKSTSVIEPTCPDKSGSAMSESSTTLLDSIPPGILDILKRAHATEGRNKNEVSNILKKGFIKWQKSTGATSLLGEKRRPSDTIAIVKNETNVKIATKTNNDDKESTKGLVLKSRPEITSRKRKASGPMEMFSQSCNQPPKKNKEKKESNGIKKEHRKSVKPNITAKNIVDTVQASSLPSGVDISRDMENSPEENTNCLIVQQIADDPISRIEYVRSHETSSTSAAAVNQSSLIKDSLDSILSEELSAVQIKPFLFEDHELSTNMEKAVEIPDDKTEHSECSVDDVDYKNSSKPSSNMGTSSGSSQRSEDISVQASREASLEVSEKMQAISRKISIDEDTPGKNIGLNKIDGTSDCVPIHTIKSLIPIRLGHSSAEEISEGEFEETDIVSSSVLRSEVLKRNIAALSPVSSGGMISDIEIEDNKNGKLRIGRLKSRLPKPTLSSSRPSTSRARVSLSPKKSRDKNVDGKVYKKKMFKSKHTQSRSVAVTSGSSTTIERPRLSPNSNVNKRKHYLVKNISASDKKSTVGISNSIDRELARNDIATFIEKRRTSQLTRDRVEGIRLVNLPVDRDNITKSVVEEGDRTEGSPINIASPVEGASESAITPTEDIELNSKTFTTSDEVTKDPPSNKAMMSSATAESSSNIEAIACKSFDDPSTLISSENVSEAITINEGNAIVEAVSADEANTCEAVPTDEAANVCEAELAGQTNVCETVPADQANVLADPTTVLEAVPSDQINLHEAVHTDQVNELAHLVEANELKSKRKTKSSTKRGIRKKRIRTNEGTFNEIVVVKTETQVDVRVTEIETSVDSNSLPVVSPGGILEENIGLLGVQDQPATEKLFMQLNERTGYFVNVEPPDESEIQAVTSNLSEEEEELGQDHRNSGSIIESGSGLDTTALAGRNDLVMVDINSFLSPSGCSNSEEAKSSPEMPQLVLTEADFPVLSIPERDEESKESDLLIVNNDVQPSNSPNINGNSDVTSSTPANAAAHHMYAEISKILDSVNCNIENPNVTSPQGEGEASGSLNEEGSKNSEDEMPILRIRSDLFSDSDIDEKTEELLGIIHEKGMTIQSAVCTCLLKFANIFQTGAAKNKLEIFKELKGVFSKSFYILDRLDVMLTVEDILKFDLPCSNEYDQYKHITVEEMADYFVRLYQLTMMLRNKEYSNHKSNLFILHFRITRILRYYAISKIPGTTEGNFMNIVKASESKIRNIPANRNEVVRVWDYIKSFAFPVDEHLVLQEHATVKVKGFVALIDAIIAQKNRQKDSLTTMSTDQATTSTQGTDAAPIGTNEDIEILDFAKRVFCQSDPKSSNQPCSSGLSTSRPTDLPSQIIPNSSTSVYAVGTSPISPASGSHSQATFAAGTYENETWMNDINGPPSNRCYRSNSVEMISSFPNATESYATVSSQFSQPISTNQHTTESGTQRQPSRSSCIQPANVPIQQSMECLLGNCACCPWSQNYPHSPSQSQLSVSQANSHNSVPTNPLTHQIEVGRTVRRTLEKNRNQSANLEIQERRSSNNISQRPNTGLQMQHQYQMAQVLQNRILQQQNQAQQQSHGHMQQQRQAQQQFQQRPAFICQPQVQLTQHGNAQQRVRRNVQAPMNQMLNQQLTSGRIHVQTRTNNQLNPAFGSIEYNPVISNNQYSMQEPNPVIQPFTTNSVYVTNSSANSSISNTTVGEQAIRYRTYGGTETVNTLNVTQTHPSQNGLQPHIQIPAPHTVRNVPVDPLTQFRTIGSAPMVQLLQQPQASAPIQQNSSSIHTYQIQQQLPGVVQHQNIPSQQNNVRQLLERQQQQHQPTALFQPHTSQVVQPFQMQLKDTQAVFSGSFSSTVHHIPRDLTRSSNLPENASFPYSVNMSIILPQ